MNYYQMNADQLWRVYKRHYKLIREHRIVGSIQGMLNFIETSIGSTIKKKSFISAALDWVTQRKNQKQSIFEEAFGRLDVFEKIIYYLWLVGWLCGISQVHKQMRDKINWLGEFRAGSFLQRWIECTIQIDTINSLVKVNSLPMNLQHYLVRKSNSQNTMAIVFQPILSTLNQCRILLPTQELFSQCFIILNLLTEKCHKQKYHRLYFEGQVSTGLQAAYQPTFSKCLQQSAQYYSPAKQMNTLNDLDDQISQVGNCSIEIPEQKISYSSLLRTFSQLMPNCNIETLTNENQSFQIVASSQRFRLMQNVSNSKLIKFVTYLRLSQQLLTEILSNGNQMLWNKQVEQSCTVEKRQSDCQLVYHRIRQTPGDTKRDFLFIRHTFQYGKANFILDKSEQTVLYSPEKDAIRGQVVFRLMWIQACEDQPNTCWLSVLSEVHYGSNITLNDEVALTEKYLLETLDLEAYCRIISPIEPTIQSPKKSPLRSTKQQRSHKQQSYAGGEMTSQRKTPTKSNTFSNIESPSEANSILCDLELLRQTSPRANTRDCLNQKHLVSPIPCLYEQISTPKFGMWGNNWQLNETGVVCKDHDKLRQQNNFYKFLIPRLLDANDHHKVIPPIDLCASYTMLEAIARSLTLAPLLLERAVDARDVLERFKFCTSFSLSIGLLSFEVNIPLKSYTGETYQGWINGCPIYLEQISNSPNVITLFMQGRGYKLYGSYKYITELYSNELSNFSEADYAIEFENCKQRVHIRAPFIDVQGLAYSDRTFKLRDNSYCFDEQNLLFSEMNFCSIGVSLPWPFKYYKQFDKVEGEIKQTTRDFLNKFMMQNKKIKPLAGTADKTISYISGRWTHSLCFDDIQYYNVRTNLPCKLQRQQYPIPSDSCLREDVKAIVQGDWVLAKKSRDILEMEQRWHDQLHDKLKC